MENNFSMADFTNSLTSLFSFLITQLTNLANFFTQSLLGQIILCLALFGAVFSILLTIANKVHK